MPSAMTQEAMGGVMSDNNRRPPKQDNGLHGYCRAYTPTSYGQYAEGLGTLRASGGDYGGGQRDAYSAIQPKQRDDMGRRNSTNAPGFNGIRGGYVPMIVEPLIFRDDITIKVGGALPLPSKQNGGDA